MATPPRSAAERSLSPPSRRPIGVRAPETITLVERESDMVLPPSRAGTNGWCVTCDDTHATPVIGSGWDVRNCSHPLARRGSSDHDGRMTALDLPEHLITAIDHVGIAVPDLDEAV